MRETKKIHVFAPEWKESLVFKQRKRLDSFAAFLIETIANYISL